MNIFIGSDHGGFQLKNMLKAENKNAVFTDVGCNDGASCDYPDFADAVACAVAGGKADFGVLVCTSGEGMTMAANRFDYCRAALCRTVDDARAARAHNDANILCLGAGATDAKSALAILEVFAATAAEDSERHIRRRAKIERACRLADFSALAKDDPGEYLVQETKKEKTRTYNEFKGTVGWRYGVVALLENDERVYGESRTEREGTVSFDIPEKTKALFFVVVGTSDKYVPHPWDATELNDPQAPYAVRIAYE